MQLAAANGRVERSDDVHVQLGVVDQVELEHSGENGERTLELAQREQHQRSELPPLRLEEAAPSLAARVQHSNLQRSTALCSYNVTCWAPRAILVCTGMYPKERGHSALYSTLL